MKTQKGFTLIELLVVIAIIGILAGILFVAINPKAQTDKANDASSESTLGQVTTQAAMDDATSFANVCTNATTKALLTAAGVADPTQEANCTADDNNFAAQMTGNTKYLCVDATGLHTVKKDGHSAYTIDTKKCVEH